VVFAAARRQYRALVASWPVSAEAGAAQRELAELLDAQGRSDAAFEAYQLLSERYPDQRPFREILDRQFELAEAAMTRRRYRWMFGGWTAPERAVPMLEQLARAAPGWPRAAEAQFLIGEAHRRNGDWLDAVIAYQELLIRFPQSPFVEAATLHRVAALERLARDAPNDPLARDEAWTAARHALRQYPESERRDELRRIADELEARRIAAAWAVARHYDRHHLAPEAARLSYERFLTQFPDTPHTARAQERMRWFAERAARARPDPVLEAPDAPIDVEEN
jgi:tetratricopeptide (TPR) repeat protein